MAFAHPFVPTSLPTSLPSISPSTLPRHARVPLRRRVPAAVQEQPKQPQQPQQPISSPPPAANPMARLLTVVPDAANNRSLWGLALVASLWTISNLMVVSILPVYLRDVLALSSTKIGLVESLAIFSAFLSKMLSGLLSDISSSRLLIIVLGAVMTAVSKPLFALAMPLKHMFGPTAAFNLIVANKVFDRLSKGVRAAPTDALLADLSPGKARGRAYSLLHAASTFGGVVGSLLCTLAMILSGNAYRLVFLLAAIPAVLAILLLLTIVRQPSSLTTPDEEASEKPKQKSKADWKSAFKLSPRFYAATIVISLLYMARFSESFVMLRARSVGLSLSLIPLLATANQVVQSLLTYPMGVLADKFDARVVLCVGWTFIIASHLLFLSVPTASATALAFILVAVHMAMTQANTKGLLSQTLLPHQRGTGFAVFSVISGVALAGGNLLAGWANDLAVRRGMGMVGCFYSGAFFSSVSLVLLFVYLSVFGAGPSPTKAKKPSEASS